MREMKDSGIDWIGNVPSEWRNSKVKHIASFYNGDRSKAYPSGDDIKTSGVPFLTSDNVHGLYVETGRKKDKFLSDAKYRELNGAKLQIGDIVFCLRGSLGACGLNLNLKEGTVASSLTVLRPNQDEVIPEFLNYCLHSPVVLIQTDYLMNGSCADNLSAHSVGNYCICIPPMQEQCQITRYLDERCAAINEDVAKRREVIEKLKEYKKSLIAHAVTKGLDPNVEMKASGVEWIGEVPASWDMLRIYQLAFPVKNKNEGMKENNLLSLSYGNIVQKDINKVDGLVPASYEGYNIIEPGDIVLRFTDLQNDQRSLRTGLCSFNGIITSAYLTIRPRHELVSSEYFHYVLHFVDTLKVFYNMGGGMRQSLDWHGVSHMFLPIPPQAEQCRIVAYLDERCAAIDEAVSRQEKLIEKLGEYRKSIIHHAVTGKIDCTEA